MARQWTSGNLPVSETPQFVLITIDDYMNDRNSRDVDEVLRIPGHTNPHGGPIPFTFFVSSDASDYHWIQRRHAQGSEIGLHTMTHTTGVDTTAEDWRVELVHLRDALVQLSGIPRADLVGFRAPFLKINHACFKVLSEDDHIMYDASLFFDVRPLAFPHKFTSIGQDFCQSREFAECPVIPHPNLWESTFRSPRLICQTTKSVQANLRAPLRYFTRTARTQLSRKLVREFG
eukprot:289528_1